MSGGASVPTFWAYLLRQKLPFGSPTLVPFRPSPRQKDPVSYQTRKPEIDEPMTPPLPPLETPSRNSKRRKPDSGPRFERVPSVSTVEARFNQCLRDLEDRMTIKLHKVAKDIKGELAEQIEEMCRFQRAEMKKLIRNEVFIAAAQTMQACMREEIREAVKGITLTFRGDGRP